MSRCHSFPPPGYQIRYEAIFDLLKEIKKDVEKERKKRKNMEKRLKKMETRSKTRFHKKQRIEEDPKPILKVEDDITVEFKQTSSQIPSGSLDNTQIEKQSNDSHGNGDLDKLSTSSSPQESNESSLLCSNCPHSDAIHFTNLIENWILKPIPKLDDDSTVEFEQTPSHIQKQSNHFHGNGVVLDKLSTSSSPQESNESSLLCSNFPHSDAIHFTNLIENWIPNKIQRILSKFEDLEWVLKSPNSEKFGANKDEVSNFRASYGRCSSMWPIACYLPEAKVLALPFTVPF